MLQIEKKHLCCSSLLLVVPVFYFLFYSKQKPWPEYVLALSLVLVVFCSQLFWRDPVQHSIIHKIDALVAKVVLFVCVAYTLVFKYRLAFVFILLLIAVSFFFSNYYSSRDWCCNHHLISHASLHVLCFIALFYTFSPVWIE